MLLLLSSVNYYPSLYIYLVHIFIDIDLRPSCTMSLVTVAYATQFN